jgi:transcriptional regulator with PAS, ATPase and Fis domain
VQKFSREFDQPIDGITPRAAIVLQRHNWPGNIRELEHVIGRACMLSKGPMLDVADLPEEFARQSSHSSNASPASSPLADQERRLLEEALRVSAGNQSAAARKLGIGRDALRYKMKRYRLST